MNRCAALVVFVLASIAVAQSQDLPQERVSALLDRGNAALARAMDSSSSAASKQSALREATAAYGTVLDGGLDGPALRLNLAAAEAQLGDRGRAALHLRAAGRLARERHDEGALRTANSAFVALRPGEGEAWPPKMLPAESRFALSAAESAGAMTLAGVFIGCWTVGWLLLGARVARVGARTPVLAIAALLLAGALSGGLLVSASIADARADRLGVILRDGVTPRAGPGDAFDAVAGAAVAASDVRILSERDGWAKVELSSGVQAWLPIDAIARISAQAQ